MLKFGLFRRVCIDHADCQLKQFPLIRKWRNSLTTQINVSNLISIHVMCVREN